MQIVRSRVTLDFSVSVDVMTFSPGLEKYELSRIDVFCKHCIVSLNMKLFRGIKVGARLLGASLNVVF